jgi:hypothetical protein
MQPDQRPAFVYQLNPLRATRGARPRSMQVLLHDSFGSEADVRPRCAC